MSNLMTEAPAALKLARILTPIDFSDSCRRAAEFAETLARHFDAELILLHAVAPVTLPFAAGEALAYAGRGDLLVQRVAECTALLESFLEDHWRGLAVRRVVVESDPVGAILQYASERRCDLIVMPTHGGGALHRLIAGSITAEALRHACCPVWTSPHFEESPKTTFRNVLCALDLAPESRGVLAWAGAFAREFDATLRLVHAIPMSTVRSGPLYFDPDWHIHVANEARRELAGMQHDAGVTAETDIELGDVPGAVVTAARETAADLLVIGRGPRSYAIVRDAPCPVVAV
jgi:nucleotide-binding universal stress UspA family protein